MTKTEFLLIGSRQRQSSLKVSPTLTINGVKVKQVTNTISLGVIIDYRLDWSSHIEKLIKKVASGIGAVKRVRHLVPQTTLKSIYQAIIQPHFYYCNSVWGNCGSTLQDLTFSNYDTNAGHLFNILGWKNVK